MKKTFKLEDKLNQLKDTRVNPTYSTVFMSLIGNNPRLIVDFELYKGSVDSSKKDEGELTVTKRLLGKVRETYKGMVDVVVYDALLCNSIWINHCIENKFIPVVHVKKNNILSIKEAKRRIGKSNCKTTWSDDKRDCEVKAYEESFDMDSVNKRLRFVKFSKKSLDGKYSQVLVVTTDFDIPLKTLYKIMLKRGNIENSIFDKLKTYAELEHYFVYHPNAIV